MFLGYSFNDPDIKQIFTWVKDILKKDFQRAYLINVDDEYDPNKEEYYKNLGINVIFAKAWLDDTENMKPSDLLNGTLDKIQASKKLKPIEKIYNQLKDFDGLNYVYKKYIEKVFKPYGIRVNQDNYLYSVDTKNTANVLSDIYDSDTGNGTPNIRKLRSIIDHSSVEGYKLNDESIELAKKSKTAEWAEAVFNFNFEKLKKIKAENDKFLSGNDPKMYLIQASISYYLGDYIASYNYLKQASRYETVK